MTQDEGKRSRHRSEGSEKAAEPRVWTRPRALAGAHAQPSPSRRDGLGGRCDSSLIGVVMSVAVSTELQHYFERVGYSGAPDPALETLRALHLRHTQAIAFENLNPLL